VLLLATAILAPRPATAASAIVADHASVDAAAIPGPAIAAAAATRVALRHASVGSNIDSGLDQLQAANVRYDRSRFAFFPRGNPGWQAKIQDLRDFVAAQPVAYDVYSMKFCFIDTDADWPTYRDAMLALEAQYPTRRFVWWTIPIERDTAYAGRAAFNDAARAYANANGKALFDIADIETWDAAGNRRVDAYGRELQQPAWSSDGGHLSTAGALRVASAWWWLVARLAGWTGGALAVSSVSPVNGPIAGGNSVTLTGYGFAAGASVSFGGTAATGVVVASPTQISAVAPAHATGLVDVSVTVPGLGSAARTQAYFYAPFPVASLFYTLTPCRLADTRSGTPLGAGERRVFPAAGQCGVSASARAVALNLTATGSTADGYLSPAPGNGLSGSSALNFRAGVTRASNTVVLLATDGTGGVSLRNGSTGTTHVVIDVCGYFE